MGRAFNYGPQDAPVHVHVCTTRLHRRRPGCWNYDATLLGYPFPRPRAIFAQLAPRHPSGIPQMLRELLFRRYHSGLFAHTRTSPRKSRIPCADDSRLSSGGRRIIGVGEIDHNFALLTPALTSAKFDFCARLTYGLNFVGWELEKFAVTAWRTSRKIVFIR